MSVARGTLAFALALVIAASVWRVVRLGSGPAVDPAPSCCEFPVEVVEPDGMRVGCRGDAELRSCGVVLAGDRVDLRGATCQVERDGMSAALRLLQGLGLNVNQASGSELELIDGIGPHLAEAIVEFRQSNGPFATLEALLEVRGIGEVTLERLRPFLTVHGSDATTEPRPAERGQE